jgi:hypothetical protein
MRAPVNVLPEPGGRYLGNEMVGTMVPSAYKGNITLHRTIVIDAGYVDRVEYVTTSNEDDTSLPPLRDDNPQSGGSAGKVYDLDAPGPLPSDGILYRYRANMRAYAALADGTRISPYYLYNVRISCKGTPSASQFVNDVPGDNQIGSGFALPTWDLKP